MMTGPGSVNPSATGPDRKPRFILFKQHVVTAHDSHFAGGKHAFSSMACKLAEEGHDVHVVSIAERSKVQPANQHRHCPNHTDNAKHLIHRCSCTSTPRIAPTCRHPQLFHSRYIPAATALLLLPASRRSWSTPP